MQTHAATIDPMPPHVPHPDEVAAAAIALHGTVPQRLKVSATALLHLLRNPQDTEQVFVLGVALNAHRFPSFMARFLAEDEGGRLLREQPTIDSRSVDFDRLLQLPADTLGGAFARHMKTNQLDPDLFQAPPGLPATVAYVAKRVRQTHDIWHVLTGYGTDVPGELALQAFYWAHMGMPSSAAITVLGSLRYATKFRDRRLFAMVKEGFDRGRAVSRFLPTVYWEELWDKPLDEVRAMLHIAPLRS